MELLRITRQIHCTAVEQRATLIHRQYNRDWGTSYSRPPIDPYLTSPCYKILAAPLLPCSLYFSIGNGQPREPALCQYCSLSVHFRSIYCIISVQRILTKGRIACVLVNPAASDSILKRRMRRAALSPADMSAAPFCCGVCCSHSLMHFSAGGEDSP